MPTGAPSPGEVPKPLTRYQIPILANTLRILEAIKESAAPMRVPELSLSTGTSKSSVFRIVATLAAHGYLEHDDASGGYRLGGRVLDLARAVPHRDGIQDHARPFLKTLHQQFGETVNLGALRGNRLVYVDAIESNHAFRMSTPPGSAIPTHASALGKAILSRQPEDRVEALLRGVVFERFTPKTIGSRARLLMALARVRQKGVAYDDEEVELGACCVAVPVRDPGGHASHAISISGPTARIAPRRREITAALIEASRDLETSVSPRPSGRDSR